MKLCLNSPSGDLTGEIVILQGDLDGSLFVAAVTEHDMATNMCRLAGSALNGCRVAVTSIVCVLDVEGQSPCSAAQGRQLTTTGKSK